MEQGKHTYQEIITQTATWEEALASLRSGANTLRKMAACDYDQVVFTGCGSTYYLSCAGAALFQQLTGKPTRPMPGSELLFNPQVVLAGDRTLLVAVSRSGSTTETVRAVERFRRENRGDVIVITNYGDQPLTALGDTAIVIPGGQEKSVAQTRSFASMYVTAAGLSALFAGRKETFKSHVCPA